MRSEHFADTNAFDQPQKKVRPTEQNTSLFDLQRLALTHHSVTLLHLKASSSSLAPLER